MNAVIKFAVLAGVSALSCGQAWAQSATAQSDNADKVDVSDNVPATGGEIIVTAERRSQRLLDVPLSISAITSDDLARLNASQMRDYADTIPGLTLTPTGGAGQNQLTIRGVTSGSDVSSTVGVYVDDVPYSGSTVFSLNTSLALDAGLFDLERIELLRGPQGTLYGASSMGGVLKYVTPRPSLRASEIAGQAGVSFTKDGGTNLNFAAALGVPVVEDKLGVRASGYYVRDGGFIDNIARGENNVGSAEIYGGRIDILLQATDDLAIRLVGFTQEIDRDGRAFADFLFTGQPLNGPLEQSQQLAEPFDQSFQLVSGTVEYDFGFAALTSITSYQKNDYFYRADASALYVPLLGFVGIPLGATGADFGAITEKFTQEIRLASAEGPVIDWIVGGFYTDEDNTQIVNLVPFNADGSLFPVNLLTTKSPSTYREIAGFGNITVHLSDRLDVTGGIRYAHNEQSYTQTATGILVPSAPTNRSSEGVLTYLANARYSFSDNASAYVRVATGYRPGGPNVITLDPLTGAPLGDPTFESDTLTSYEVGFKGETLDRTFAIDVAAYHIDWNDISISRVINGFNSYVNAARAKIDGAELNLTARPSREVSISGAFAYQDARLSEASADLGAAQGERLPNIPRFTAAVNADYRATSADIAPAFGATLRFVTDRQSSFAADTARPSFDLGDYVTVDLRAGAEFGPVKVQVFVRNLFNEFGAYSANTLWSPLGGPAQVSVLQPRTIGVNFRSDF